MRRLGLIFASAFGVGYMPWASGTFGTLWAVLVFYLTRHWAPTAFLGLWAAVFALSILSSHYAEQALGQHDSSVIVIDEVIGYLTAVLFVPYHFWNLVLAFVLFRFFDIVKPPPIRQIDRGLPGAWGVVLDDVLAGVFANLVLRLIWLGWRPA